MITLVGCFGLVSVAPLTALAASWLLTGKPSGKITRSELLPGRTRTAVDPHEA